MVAHSFNEGAVKSWRKGQARDSPLAECPERQSRIEDKDFSSIRWGRPCPGLREPPG